MSMSPTLMQAQENYAPPTPSKRLPTIFFSSAQLTFPSSLPRTNGSTLFSEIFSPNPTAASTHNLFAQSSGKFDDYDSMTLDDFFEMTYKGSPITPAVFRKTPDVKRQRRSSLSALYSTGLREPKIQKRLTGEFDSVHDDSNGAESRGFDTSLDTITTLFADEKTDTTQNEDFLELPQLKKKKPRRVSKKNRKKRTNEWKDEEVVILLQLTKLMVGCELKTLAKALFSLIEREQGKSFGRAAEKKLRRMGIFENWKKTKKEIIVQNVDRHLKQLSQNGQGFDLTENVKQVAEKYKSIEALSKSS
eukprot:snap_masked-scaffold_8-processed-gene-12.31-mRNA-1 protein AED:1.00 eAED:1.00 QI:0/-1/0/0/-1/1/1/0/303